jgi:hypothetical protein
MVDVLKPGATVEIGGQPSGGAGTPSPKSEVPKGLERFAGEDGKIDHTKLGQSFLEAEKTLYKQGQELSALKRMLDAYGSARPAASTVDPEEERGREFERLVKDPKGYTEGVVHEGVANEAKAVKAAILRLAHPEMDDPKFKEGLDQFAATLPPHIQMALDDYNTADWVVRLYKQQIAGAAGATPAGGGDSQHIESPSGSPQGGGKKMYARSWIRNLQATNPDEYARLSDEIALAYKENRVKLNE